MGPIAILAVLVLVCVGIFFWLNAREQKREEQGKPRLGNLRLVIAAIAGIIILFSGGCGGLFFIGMLMDGSQGSYIGPEVIAIFALPPLAIGLLIWWLALRRPS